MCLLPYEVSELCMLPMITVLLDDLWKVCERLKVSCGQRDVEPEGSVCSASL